MDTAEHVARCVPYIDLNMVRAGRWMDQFVHLMGHTGNYTREEAIAADVWELLENVSVRLEAVGGRAVTGEVSAS